MMLSNRSARDPHPLRLASVATGEASWLTPARGSGDGADPTGGVTGPFQWAILWMGRTATCAFLMILYGETHYAGMPTDDGRLVVLHGE